MTTSQLTLLVSEDHWKLDEKTRRIGRDGIARARAVLAAHAPVETPAEAA